METYLDWKHIHSRCNDQKESNPHGRTGVHSRYPANRCGVIIVLKPYGIGHGDNLTGACNNPSKPIFVENLTCMVKERKLTSTTNRQQNQRRDLEIGEEIPPSAHSLALKRSFRLRKISRRR
jgi:hypothetical protein